LEDIEFNGEAGPQQEPLVGSLGWQQLEGMCEVSTVRTDVRLMAIKEIV